MAAEPGPYRSLGELKHRAHPFGVKHDNRVMIPQQGNVGEYLTTPQSESFRIPLTGSSGVGGCTGEADNLLKSQYVEAFGG
jgi:hypothetical protein